MSLQGKKCGNMELRSAIMGMREQHQIDVRVVYEKADTERYLKEALDMGTVDVLVCAGGDGSINEVQLRVAGGCCIAHAANPDCAAGGQCTAEAGGS